MNSIQNQNYKSDKPAKPGKFVMIILLAFVLIFWVLMLKIIGSFNKVETIFMYLVFPIGWIWMLTNILRDKAVDDRKFSGDALLALFVFFEALERGIKIDPPFAVFFNNFVIPIVVLILLAWIVTKSLWNKNKISGK